MTSLHNLLQQAVLTSGSIQEHLLVWFALSVNRQPLGGLDQSVSGVLYHLEGRWHVLLELLILSASHCLLPNLQASPGKQEGSGSTQIGTHTIALSMAHGCKLH